MGYLLQYQAHVDDLTSLAGNPEDTSWFSLQPYEQPEAPTLLVEGFLAADLTSGAVAVDDQSWLVRFDHEQPEPQQLPDLGFFAADLHSAGGKPDDVSWFPTFPHEMPLERAVAPAGFIAGDFTTGAAAAITWTNMEPPYRLVLFTAANWATNAWVGEAMVRATTGTAYLRIYDEDGAAAIAGSQVSTASGTFVRLRTPSVTLTDGNEHRLQFGSEAGDAGEAHGGVLIQGA